MEDHNDPYGYNEGAPVPSERAELVHSGDIIATVMGEKQSTVPCNCTIGIVTWPGHFSLIMHVTGSDCRLYV